MNTKHYGIDKKNQIEDLIYSYARTKAWMSQFIPGKNQKWRRDYYRDSFCDDHSLFHNSNAIPDKHYVKRNEKHCRLLGFR